MKTCTTKKKPRLSPELMERMATLLRLLAHPDRLRIIEFLEEAGEAPVHEIMAETRLAQAVASQHLNQMKRLDVVHSRRNGKEVWYRIANPSSLFILDCIRKHS